MTVARVKLLPPGPGEGAWLVREQQGALRRGECRLGKKRGQGALPPWARRVVEATPTGSLGPYPCSSPPPSFPTSCLLLL